MKKIKMLIYGEPGVGKSVFASKAPKPFFITTDGNYEWLEDFGADPNAFTQVNSWEESKKAFANDYAEYETIVVDLLEDMFKWCEHEYCVRSKIDHVSDIGYGKGYDITRNEFFFEIAKLLAKNKHVILISHGITFVTKDRRGVEHTKYGPSSRIPDKVMDMIEGRLRYCLRCYCKAEEQADGTLIKRRFLSLVPKENEFGIIRGVDENTIPHDIPLDFNEFAKCIGLNDTASEDTKRTIFDNMTAKTVVQQPVVEIIAQQPVVEQTKVVEPVENTSVAKVDTAPWEETVKTEIKAEPKVESVQETPKQPQSNADKIAAIKAKLAAIKANKE